MAVVLFCASAPLRLCAQTPDSLNLPHVPAVVHYGKWATLAGSIYLGVTAQQRHADANDTYNALRASCNSTPTGCSLVSGRYSDPGNEVLYQETRRLDHQAARYLIGAEALFAASAAGFVWDLIESRPRQRNIPFHPRVEPTEGATRVSLTIRF